MPIPSQPTLASSSTRRSKSSKAGSKSSKAPSSGHTMTPPANQQALGGTGGPAGAPTPTRAPLPSTPGDSDEPMSVAVRKQVERPREAHPATRKFPVSPEGAADPSTPPSQKIPSAAASDDDDLPLAVGAKKRKRATSVSRSVNLADNDAYFF